MEFCFSKMTNFNLIFKFFFYYFYNHHENKISLSKYKSYKVQIQS